jgi:hypothetical protein
MNGCLGIGSCGVEIHFWRFAGKSCGGTPVWPKAQRDAVLAQALDALNLIAIVFDKPKVISQ